MLPPTPSSLSTAIGLGSRPHLAPRQITVTVAFGAAAGPAAAPASRPRRLADALDGLLTDGARLATPASSLAAARAFAAGNGFLPGQLIDRAI